MKFAYFEKLFHMRHFSLNPRADKFLHIEILFTAYCDGTKNIYQFYIHPCQEFKCSHFVKCVGSAYFVTPCPPGTSFDASDQRCEFSSRVASCSNTQIRPIEPPNQNPPNTNPPNPYCDPNNPWSAIFCYNDRGFDAQNGDTNSQRTVGNFMGHNGNYRRN